MTALLIHKAIGKKLVCIFVDNGLLRKDEGLKLKKTLKQHLDINIRFVNAKDRFLKALAGVTDPEKKRKIIGKVTSSAKQMRLKSCNYFFSWIQLTYRLMHRINFGRMMRIIVDIN